MLKIEMLYSQEYRYYNLQELTKAIAEYIATITKKEYWVQPLKK